MRLLNIVIFSFLFSCGSESDSSEPTPTARQPLLAQANETTALLLELPHNNEYVRDVLVSKCLELASEANINIPFRSFEDLGRTGGICSESPSEVCNSSKQVHVIQCNFTR